MGQQNDTKKKLGEWGLGKLNKRIISLYFNAGILPRMDEVNFVMSRFNTLRQEDIEDLRVLFLGYGKGKRTDIQEAYKKTRQFKGEEKQATYYSRLRCQLNLYPEVLKLAQKCLDPTFLCIVLLRICQEINRPGKLPEELAKASKFVVEDACEWLGIQH